MAVLLRDLSLPDTAPLSRFRTIFSMRSGILTEIERVKFLSKDSVLFYHSNLQYARLVAEIDGLEPVQEVPVDDSIRVIDSAGLSPVKMTSGIGDRIRADLDLLHSLSRPFLNGAADGKRVTALLNASLLVGPPENFWIHPGATLLPGSIMDLSEGPIVIDDGARITPFTYIEGPAYIGKGARVDNARITGGCVIGHQVRVGGEIENSILNDFTNKHHEGFLGHSVTGSWVNLGALSTTSDLKNNYGMIRLDLPAQFIPDGEMSAFETGTIKFGSVLGDCVKIAIGTMLNTGSVVDAGSNLFGGCPRKYTPPLSWGVKDRYDIDKFISDQNRIFRRRGLTPHKNISTLAEMFISKLR